MNEADGEGAVGVQAHVEQRARHAQRVDDEGGDQREADEHGTTTFVAVRLPSTPISARP